MRKLFVLLFLTGSINVFGSDVRLFTVTGSANKILKPDIGRIYLYVPLCIGKKGI
ncbi:MAG: hypothetical protein H7336_07725 [Bacteriovorax sp.]|nr:hypothetical protein [Bacteriovorax sp.]